MKFNNFIELYKQKLQPCFLIQIFQDSFYIKLYHIIIMGLTASASPLVLAAKMRQDLYSRVRNFSKKYVASFEQIPIQTKRKICKSSAIQIADMIDSRQITSLQATLAFIERTIQVGVENNYVFDELFEEAVSQALLIDQKRNQDNHEKKCWRPGLNPQECYPPFYGVPASIKQTMVMKNRQVHVGFVSKINPISDKDGLFVVLVRKMGFIPFVRTNVPQGCKTNQTNNNIFGYSKNPWIKNRTCGGSSGGQSGIVSSNCSPIGFGSDIGGSLRFPAAFTGLVTLKASNRYSKMGNCYYGKFTGGLPIKSELGPIGKTVKDILIVHNYLYNPQNYQTIPLQDRDPYMKYIPLDMNVVEQKRKYKIGLVKRLKYAKCSKANQRALKQASQIFRRQGHQIVEINLQNLEKLYFFLINIFTFDQKLHLFSQFQGKQPLTVEFKLLALASKIPWFIRRLIMWFIRRKQPRLYQILKASRPLDGTTVFQKIYEIEKIISPQIYRAFAINKLDAVLISPFVTPAPKHGEVGKLQYFFSFSTSWNVLGYPAGVVPMTVVRADEQDFHDQFNDFYTKNVRSALKGSRGLPIGVQIVSTPYNQQKIFNLMQQLQSIVNFRQKHQIPQE